MQFNASDFVPLEDFSLVWRWTSPRHAQLPPETLKQIQRLAPERAAAVAKHLESLIEGQGLGGPMVGPVSRLQAHGTAETSRELDSLVGSFSGSVAVSWSNDTAVVAPWALFVSNWDDFCYPSSDDILIVPLQETWALLYHHSEVFEFAELRAA